MYRKTSYSKLQKLCRRRDLDYEGCTKAQLIELLEEADEENELDCDENDNSEDEGFDYSPYHTLVIGMNKDSDISVVKEATLFTGTKKKETLPWFDLTNTDTVPPSIFTEILVCDSSLLDKERKIHRILRTLDKEGSLCVKGGGADDYLNYGLEYTGIRKCQINKKMVSFARYERPEETLLTKNDTPLARQKQRERKRRPPQKYTHIKVPLKIRDTPAEPIYGLTVKQFRKELDDPEFIRNFVESQKKLLEYKLEFYYKKIAEMKSVSEKKKQSLIKATGSDPEADYISYMEDLIKIIKSRLETITEDSTRDNLIEALEDEDRGLSAIIGRSHIKNDVVTQLYAFSRQYEVMTNCFYNIALLGPAGSGKTHTATILSFVYSKSGILATDVTAVITRADIVGSHIGETAIMTRGKLLMTLEGILFIDECYQLCNKNGGERDYGFEAVAQIVNFIDKFIGMSIIIVAGYEKPMLEKFFPSNEGLLRRFPSIFVLPPYTIHQLTDILLNFVEQKTKMKIDRVAGNKIFSIISKIHQSRPHAFENQAGDMLNLGTYLSRVILGSYGKDWKESVEETVQEGFNRTLSLKGLSIEIKTDT